MKKIKKIKNLLFIIAIALVGFIGINNVNASEKYSLFVNGEEFTSDKTTINCGEGTATFDNETSTLTLNNATINDGYGITNVDDIYTKIGIYYHEQNTKYDEYDDIIYRNIKIVLKGVNTINSQYDAIDMDSNLSIEGPGTLNINLDETQSHYSASSILVGGNLIINNANININNADNDEEILACIWAGTETAEASINNSNISIKNGCISMYGSLDIIDSTININNNIYVSYRAGIELGGGTIDGNTNINITGVDTGINIYEHRVLGIDDVNISVSANEAFSGKISLDGFDGKVVASWYPEKTNADVISKEKLEKNPYYSFVKMGDFETYKITNKSTNNLIEMPKETVEGAPIEFYEWSNVYKINKVQILKASDNSDVTSEVNYDNENHKFIMPAYSVIVKATVKTTYNSIPKAISAKLDKYNAVKVSWTQDDNNYFDGCYIYYKKSTESTWKKITWTLKSYYIKTDLEPGVKYNFKVVPMVRVYNAANKLVNIESTKYKLINIYTLKKMNLPTITKYNDSKVQVKWKKVEGASGYEIARSVYKTRNYSVVKTVNNKYIGYKLDTKANKTYYYKVRVYRLSDGKKIYGPWSNYKSFRLQ